MPNDRIVSIQYLRGLAALGVVCFHFGNPLSPIFNFGQNGVHVFFLISGFIIVFSLLKSNYKPGMFFSFLLKRSARIDPPYYVTILLIFVLFKALTYIPGFKGSAVTFIPGEFLAHIFYYVPFTNYTYYSVVFWTLSVEFQFYTFIGILYFLSKNKYYKIAFLVLFSLSSLVPFSNPHDLVFTYAPIFSLGISLVTFYQNRDRLNLVLPALLLGLIAFKFGIPIFILMLVSSAAIFYFNQTIKPLAFLGTISYSLYLTHSLTIIVFLGIAKKIHINVDRFPFFWLAIEVILAIFMAYIFYLLVEKPALRLSKRIFYKKPKGLALQTG
jgi:peptidoglycan/LPS O-acetylase OafA/YrhL